MQKFLPYYQEIKLIGHFGLAYVATLAGAAAMLLSRVAGGDKVGVSFALAFSAVAAGILWIVPFVPSLPIPDEYRVWTMAGLAVACMPAIKYFRGGSGKNILLLWGFFALSQVAIFFCVYYKVI